MNVENRFFNGEEVTWKPFACYAQWPDKETWKNSGDNLPESAAEFRKQMRESCSEIKTEFEMVEVVDLLNESSRII